MNGFRCVKGWIILPWLLVKELLLSPLLPIYSIITKYVATYVHLKNIEIYLSS